MATVQRSKSTTESKPKGGRAAASKAARGSAETGEQDTSYNLISVLYHALQAAETYGQYIEDAEDNDDDELVRMFEQVRASQMDIAERAKRLLASRIAGGAGARAGSAGAMGGSMSEEDEEDLEEDEND